MPVVGSILHGAYGDYYEQAVCLRHFKRLNPDTRLILFFATESRRKELAVFDFSFADEVYPSAALTDVAVDRFLQFQIFDGELQQDILSHLPEHVLSRFNLKTNLKPWSRLRHIYRHSRDDCDIPLSVQGLQQLPECFRANGLDISTFGQQFTVGFLWRYRRRGGAISPAMQPSEDVVAQTKSQLLSRLATEYGAKIIVAGMNVKTTDENRVRTDCKFTERTLAIPEDSSIYLRGLNWGLELEIMRRCSLCIVMASGFSEALLLKRSGPTILVDAPFHYVAKLLWNRMPFFGLRQPKHLFFQLRQPHTARRVMRYMVACGYHSILRGT